MFAPQRIQHHGPEPADRREACTGARHSVAVRPIGVRRAGEEEKYLGDALPAVRKKASPLLDVMFEPPAKDIEIEFRPDQFTSASTSSPASATSSRN